MAEATVTVSVERVVHDALRDLAQSIFDEHGIRIDSVQFWWLDRSTVDGASHLTVTQTHVHSHVLSR